MFDSGEGGLTVLRRAQMLYPGENFIYAADSAHFPYGTRSLEEVRAFFLTFLDFFLEHDAKAVVIACNTATAAALDVAQKLSPVPVIGVINPGAEQAIQKTQNHIVGVLSTEATYRAGVYAHALTRLDPLVSVVSAPCPILVTMAEFGKTNGPDVSRAIGLCTEPVLSQGVDTVILGCTHFPHMEKLFEEVIDNRAVIVDPGYATAKKLAQVVGPLQTTGKGQIEFYTTGSPNRALSVARILWPEIRAVAHPLIWQDQQLVSHEMVEPVDS